MEKGEIPKSLAMVGSAVFKIVASSICIKITIASNTGIAFFCQFVTLTFIFSLLTVVGHTLGIKDPIFAVVLIFSFIVSYDAIGVRFESGKQAAAINDIVDELGKHRRKKLNIDILKEQLGHKLSEVVGGVILVFATGSIFYFLLW